MTSKVQIKRKDWESDNLDLSLAEIYLGQSEPVVQAILRDREAFLQELEHSLSNPENSFGLYEVNITSALFALIPGLEDLGFRLVDSKVNFRTKFQLKEIANPYLEKLPAKFTLRWAQVSDLKDVLGLNKEMLVDNILFSNRYKHSRFFSQEVCEKYYQSWINNTFSNPNSLFCIASLDNEIVGYFIYLKVQEPEGMALKGILTGVKSEHRGHNLHLAMQSFIFKNCGLDEVSLINSTQLGNFPVIQNHILSNRRLDGIYFTLIKKNEQFTHPI